MTALSRLQQLHALQRHAVTYLNGTYYWKVEARTSYGGMVIATSAACSFTKQELSRSQPRPMGHGLAVDPTFQWSQIVGADRYRLIVSTDPISAQL